MICVKFKCLDNMVVLKERFVWFIYEKFMFEKLYIGCYLILDFVLFIVFFILINMY